MFSSRKFFRRDLLNYKGFTEKMNADCKTNEKRLYMILDGSCVIVLFNLVSHFLSKYRWSKTFTVSTICHNICHIWSYTTTALSVFVRCSLLSIT